MFGLSTRGHYSNFFHGKWFILPVNSLTFDGNCYVYHAIYKWGRTEHGSLCIRLVVRCMASPPSFSSSILVESKFKFKSTAQFLHLAFINMLCGSCGSQGNLRTKIKANILPFFGVQTNLANSYSEIRRALAVVHILSTMLKCVLSF